MDVSRIILVLLVCALAADADIAHLKAAKAKLLGRLKGKHHKRGVLSPIPTYKVGYDIPHVTHSLLKPLVVTYPPTATVSAVKIPVPSPPGGHYPVPVGHKVHGLPHPHYGLKFPHTKFVTKPDHHFHHHHHHVAPTPVVPLPPPVAPVLPAPPAPVVPVVHAAPAPIVPIPQPTAVAQPVPIPSPPLVFPPPALSHAPIPLSAPPYHFLPQSHLFRHLRPILPAAAVPLQPALIQPPAIPSPVPYVIRPGGAIQTSVFATFPRYPFINSYQAPLIPLAPAQAVSSVQQLFVQRPQVPQFNVVHGGESGVIEHHTPNIAVDQTPTYLHQAHVTPQPEIHLHPTQETLPQTPIHLHPTQLSQPAVHLQPAHPTVSLDHDGWSPVAPQPHDVAAGQQPEVHYPNIPQFTQEQGTQVYEHHDQFHDYQHQLQHHLHQIEQAQYEQNLNNQHHVAQEYGTPQQTYGQPNDYPQQGQDISQQGHDYQQHGQVYAQSGQDLSQHGQDFSQNGQDISQHGQDFAHHGQDFSQHGQDFSQHGQDFAHQGQDFSQHGHNFAQNEYDLAQHNQYGLPQQGVEGRSGEDNSDLFHNHIPLALQPPIDRPLDHFR